MAIVLIGMSLMTLTGLSVSGLKAQEVAREQQVANGIANEVMERLRRIPFSTLSTTGIVSPDSADPAVLVDCSGEFRIRSCEPQGGLGGKVLTAPAEAAPAGVFADEDGCVVFTSFASLYGVDAADAAGLLLNPYHCTLYRLNRVDYRAYAYVSTTDGDGGLIGDAPYRLSVIVQWEHEGVPRETLLQSLVFAWKGCGGADVADGAAGPCGRARTSDYSVETGDPALEVAYCRTQYNGSPTCDAVSGGPSVEVRLPDLNPFHFDSAAGVLHAWGSLTEASLTVGGTQVWAAPRIDVDVDSAGYGLQSDSKPWAATVSSPAFAGAGPVVYEIPGITPSNPFLGASGGVNYYGYTHLGTWKLVVTTTAPSQCAGGEMACGSITAEALAGDCAPGGAPCIAAIAYLPEVEVKVCNTSTSPGSAPFGWYAPAPSGCHLIALLRGGTIAGRLNAVESYAGISGQEVYLGPSIARVANNRSSIGSEDPDPEADVWSERDTGGSAWAALKTCGSPTETLSTTPPSTACLPLGDGRFYMVQAISGGGWGWTYGYDLWAGCHDPAAFVPFKGRSPGTPITSNVWNCQSIAPDFSLDWHLSDTTGSES